MFTKIDRLALLYSTAVVAKSGDTPAPRRRNNFAVNHGIEELLSSLAHGRKFMLSSKFSTQLLGVITSCLDSEGKFPLSISAEFPCPRASTLSVYF